MCFFIYFFTWLNSYLFMLHVIELYVRDAVVFYPEVIVNTDWFYIPPLPVTLRHAIYTTENQLMI